MSHEIKERDAVVLNGKAAWHGLGTVIDQDMSALAAYSKFWKVDPVERWPLATVHPARAADLAEAIGELESGNIDDALLMLQEYRDNILSVPSHVANVRYGANGEDIMGVVGSSYQICSDEDLARFTDHLSDSGEVKIETCGTLKNGKLVWFLAKGEEFDVGAGDTVVPYICVSNAHDGSNSLRVTPTSVRVVCANTLGFCLGADGSEIGNSAISIQHTGDIEAKLAAARHAIQHYRTALADTKRRFEQLRGTPVTRSEAMKLFSSQYASYWETADNEDLANPNRAARKLAARRIERMESASRDFMTRFETEANKFGSANMWLAMNAFTGYLQHDRTVAAPDAETRTEKKIESNLFNAGAKRTFETFQKAVSLVA